MDIHDQSTYDIPREIAPLKTGKTNNAISKGIMWTICEKIRYQDFFVPMCCPWSQ